MQTGTTSFPFGPAGSSWVGMCAEVRLSQALVEEGGACWVAEVPQINGETRAEANLTRTRENLEM